MDKSIQFQGLWGIILGGSSGFGFAAVEKLAAHGLNIAVLYRELAAAEKSLLQKFAELAAQNNVTIRAYNINALQADSRMSFIKDFEQFAGKQSVKLLLHSIARGNLKPLAEEKKLIASQNQPLLSADDIQVTGYAMSASLLDWARSVLDAGLFNADARIIGLTSEGAHKYWDAYAAVSMAKASLESLCTYMAVEFSQYGIKTNLIQAGITDSLSLKKIQGYDQLIEIANNRNPFKRITKPQDVANVIYLLCTEEAAWINGSVIHADGGEHCR